MHDGTEKTEYEKNSTFEMTGAGFSPGTYTIPNVLRDSDNDPTTAGPIDCIRSRGVNIRSQWMGEIVHFQNIITQTFEIIFVNQYTQRDLKKWLEKIEEFEKVGQWFEDLDLYGIHISNCRITAIDLPTDETGMLSAIGRGQVNITVEQRVCADVDTSTGGTGFGLSSLDDRPREVIAPCYECTQDSSPTGVYVRGTGIDPQANAVSQCAGAVTTPPPSTSTTASPTSPTIGAIQVSDGLCTASLGAGTSEDALGVAGPVQDYKGLSPLLAGTNPVCSFIEDLSEDFKFNYGKGNNINFTHSVNIKLFDSCPKGVDPTGGPDLLTLGFPGPGQPGIKVPIVNEGSPPAPGEYGGDDADAEESHDVDQNISVCRPGQFNVDGALTIAREILDKDVPNFGIAFHPGVLRLIDDKKIVPYYTETQNLITGEVSMTKRLNILKERDDDLHWSADFNHSLVIDKSGIAKVTEKGKIRGNKVMADPACGAGCSNPPYIPLDPKNVVDNAYENSLSGMDEHLGFDFIEARVRCEEFWDAHKRFFKNYFDGEVFVGGPLEPNSIDPDHGLDSLLLKVEHPMEKTRSFNQLTRECSYTITFSTAANVFDNFMANRTLTASRGQFGAINIKEKSELTSYVPKGEDQKKINTAFGTGPGAGGRILPEADDKCAISPCANRVIDNPIEIMFPDDYQGDGLTTGSKIRIMDFYTDLLADTKDFEAPNPQECTDPIFGDTGLKLWSRNISWSPQGRGLSYTVEYTTDKTVSCSYPDPYGIRRTQVSTSDKLPKRMFKEHAIANNKMLVHDPKQTSLGSRNVNLTVTLERIPKHNMLEEPLLPEIALHELADRAKKEILKVFTDHEDLVADDMFVTLCKYSFTSKWQATLTVSVNYLQKK